jgi:hypothetical protein
VAVVAEAAVVVAATVVEAALLSLPHAAIASNGRISSARARRDKRVVFNGTPLYWGFGGNCGA